MEGADRLDRPPGLSYVGAVLRGGAPARGRGRGRGGVPPQQHLPVAQNAIQNAGGSRVQRTQSTRRTRRNNPTFRLPVLHQACKLGDDISRFLVSEAEINQVDHVGRNALTFAYRRARTLKDLTPLHLLMNHKDTELWVLNDDHQGRRVPLAIQAFHDRYKFGEEALIELISSSSFPIADQDAQGLNIIDHLCSVDHFLPVLNVALNQPAAAINSSAVFTAIRKDQFEALRALIAKGLPLDTYEVNTGHQPIHVACELGKWGWIDALVAAGADVNSPNLSGDTPVMVAMRKDLTITVGKLLEREGIDASRCNHEGQDLLHLFLLNLATKKQISAHCAGALIKLLNLNQIPLTSYDDDYVIDRLQPLNDWIPCDWMDKVLTKLSLETLKSIAAPLNITTDDDLKMGFLISPQTIAAAFLIDEPDYRGRLLNNLKSLFPLAAGEILEDDQGEWNQESGQLVPWVSYALWYTRPKEGVIFAEWLLSLGLDPDNIARVTDELPSKVEVRRELEASTKQVLTDCSLAALEERVSSYQKMANVGEFTSHTARAAFSTFRTQSNILTLATALNGVNVTATLEALKGASKTITALPVSGMKVDESNQSRDIGTLVMLLVPPDQSVNAANWLTEKLGLTSERGLSVLYDIGFDSEEDFEKHGISFTAFESNPDEQERQRILNFIAEQCKKGK
ncbi:MAG: hypothetical protein Q8K75_02265 [Chlamydiales bacterium]|nr:hypothetical protein [Chlamydiales bacterium]